MLEEQAIQILQFDCTMFGSFTEGRKLAALCELNHVDVAPHHDCFIHAPLVASSPAGRIVGRSPIRNGIRFRRSSMRTRPRSRMAG